MSNTVLGPTADQIPYPVYPVLVEIKEHWGDQWQTEATLELEQATLNCCGHDLDSCVLKHRYGLIKWPWASTFAAETPLAIDGWWVRVSLTTPAKAKPGDVDGNVALHRDAIVLRGRTVQLVPGQLDPVPVPLVPISIIGTWWVFPPANVDPNTVIEPANLLRMVPSSALAGLVAPIRPRQERIASSFSNTSAITGPRDMNVQRSPKKGRSLWT